MRRAVVAGGATLAAALAAAGTVTIVRDRPGEAGIVVVSARQPTPARSAPAVAPDTPAAAAVTPTSLTRTTVATMSLPWAMVFLPDGRLLVTEKRNGLRIVTTGGAVSAPLAGSPTTAEGGQGGLLDVALDPGFAGNGRVWLTFSEPRGEGKNGLAVMRAHLVLQGDAGRLEDGVVIWRQQPAIADIRHFGGRMAFSPSGLLFVTAGDRHQGTPAQDRATTLGKTIRIDPSSGRARIVSIGHRNPYGLAFTRDGRLYQSEMGPAGGDEFNRIFIDRNYGWPLVSEGNKGNGAPFPRHASDPRFTAPLVAWSPTIAPAGMIQYRGSRFAGWAGDFVLAALKGEALVRVRLRGAGAREVERIAMGARIREVEEGPDGALWILEDGREGRLIRLDPAA